MARTNFNITLAILSVIGITLVLVSTSRYGVGVSPDSITYISAARNLLSGKGYSHYFGGPLPGKPPLFPAILAIIGLTGIEPMNGARFLNALTFGLIIFTSGQLFRIYIRSKVLVILGMMSILLSIPLLKVSIMAWTEPLFLLLIILFLIYLRRFLNEKRLSILFLLSILAALSCLQRYIGGALILTGLAVLIFLMPRVSLLQRFKYAVTFGGISTIPIVVWSIRNYILSSTFTGVRLPANLTLYQIMIITLETLTGWFLPGTIPLSIRVISIGLLILTMIIAVFFLRFKFNKQLKNGLMRVLPAGIFVLIYTVSLIVSSSRAVVHIGDRLFSPIYVLIILFFLIGMENISNLLNQFLRNKRLGNSLVAVLFILWLLYYPSARVYRKVSDCMQTGAGGYNTVTWRQSPLMKWVQTNQLKGKIFSNDPGAIYILTGIIIPRSPSRKRDLQEFKKYLSAYENSYLIWCSETHRKHIYDVQEISSVIDIKELKSFPDGKVYIFQ